MTRRPNVPKDPAAALRALSRELRCSQAEARRRATRFMLAYVRTAGPLYPRTAVRA